MGPCDSPSIAVTRHNTWLLAGALVILSGLVYGHGLAVPAALAHEGEIQAQAVVLADHRGHDPEGRMLPLFLHGDRDVWLAPVPVYATAVLITLAPSASVHARWAAVVFGMTDVLLLYVVVVRCFRRAVVGFAAALVLLFTPSHVLFSRTAAPEGIWPLPFILGWALGLTALADRPSPRARWVFAAGTASLAGSAYAQPSAALIAPILAIVTIGIFRRANGWRLPDAIPASAMTAAALLPLLLWYLRFPSAHVDTFARWLLQPADVRSMYRAATVLKVFWDFFLPSHLFLTPAAHGLCGMFLSPTAVPIAVGIYALIRHTGVEEGIIDRIRPAIIAVCILGPLVAAMSTQPPSDGRALVVVPFGVWLAVWGSTVIWRHGRVVGRLVLVGVCLAAALQAPLCLGF